MSYSDCCLNQPTMASSAPDQDVKDLIATLVSTPPDLTFAFLNEQEEVLGELRAHKKLHSEKLQKSIKRRPTQKMKIAGVCMGEETFKPYL